MRIAIWHNLPSGGGKRLLYDHVRGLVERGHTVEAWCPPSADREFLPIDTLIRENVIPLDWPTKAHFSDRLGMTLATQRQLSAMDAHCRICAKHIEDGGFDILFANACMYFRSTSIGRFCSIPSVLYLGEPYRWLYEALPRLRWLAPPPRPFLSLVQPTEFKKAFLDARNMRNWRLQAREEVENAASFDRILVNSYFSRESVMRAYGLDSEVCYPGIEVDRFPTATCATTDHTFVGLGAIAPEKNVRLCIEAIATIRSHRPKLVWVGNVAWEEYHREMLQLAKSLGVNVEFKIRISDKELIDVLSRAIGMLYAPRLEPFGLAPLEANLCGLPVIAVAEGGVRETITHELNGLLVDNSPASMGAAILRLLTEPNFARELGKKARAHARENWNLDKAIDRLEECLSTYANS